MKLQLAVDPTIVTWIGSFRAHIENDVLFVPTVLMQLMRRFARTELTADRLCQLLDETPGVFLAEFSAWRSDHLLQAEQELHTLLRLRGYGAEIPLANGPKRLAQMPTRPMGETQDKPPLALIGSGSVHMRPGLIRVRIERQGLVIPLRLFAVAHRLWITDHRKLSRALIRSPDTLASSIDWSVTNVRKAGTRMLVALERAGYAPTDDLDPEAEERQVTDE